MHISKNFRNFAALIVANMTKLLGDYIFNERMRYESHRLVYRYSEEEEPVVIGGFLGAALLFVRLINTEEGDLRGIAFYSEEEQDILITRYEQEVINDDWGHLEAEINQLNDTYIQLAPCAMEVSDLFTNKRQYYIAMSMTIRYMRRLVVEVYGEHIWEEVPWICPFALWLYNAGYKETQRQRYFDIDWTDMAMVNALAEHPKGDDDDEPTFTFLCEEAEDIMRRYWEWLWENIQRQAAETPDPELELARLKELILANETDEQLMEDEVDQFPFDQQKLFRRWLARWKAFITEQLAPTALDSFPEQQRLTRVEQELFPDTITPCPEPDKYSQVRDYIHARCNYDEKFREYYKSHKRTAFCEQLSLMFQWVVVPNSLGKSLKRKKK